jgi:hypothetical protein
VSPIRVAIGEVHSSMLRDILAHITHSEPDMELVTDNAVDVVISDVGAADLPRECTELFAAPNPPVFVGLANDGRNAALCVANVGLVQLVAMIRSAMRGVRES